MATTTASNGAANRDRVLALRRKGLSGVAIGKVLGISHQAVYAHMKELRQQGRLKEKA